MTWGVRDINIVRGDSYDHVVEFEDAWVLDFTWSAWIRLDATDTESEPTLTFDVDELDLAVTGEIILSLTPEQTAELDPTLVYRWGLQGDDGAGYITSPLGGIATVDQKVTYAS